MENKTLFSKLAGVMGAVGHVPKRGRNAFHKYDYVMEADLVDAVRNKLAEVNVVLFTSVEQVTREGTLTTIQAKFTFADGDSGETYTVAGAGQGEDKGDKGVYKAITGAVKYMIMKNFLIPTGDDPEADEETDKRASRPAPKPQVAPASRPSPAATTPPAKGEVAAAEIEEPKSAEVAEDHANAMARFFGLLDKLRASGAQEDAYKEFFKHPRAKGAPPSLEVIATWSEPQHLKFLDTVCDKIEKAVA